MKHLVLGFIFLLGMTGQAQVQKKTIGVLEFVSSGDLSKKEVLTLTKRFRDMLVQTNTFRVLERDKMDAILKEQNFILSDDCNSAECAVQVGQLLGVEKMISGDLGKVGKTWTIGLRLIDMSTGEIERTETLDFQGETDGMLEIMRQAAYVFAGLEIPKGKSVVYFKGNVVKSPPIPSHLQGRIKLELLVGPPFDKSSGGGLFQYSKWKDGHPTGKMYTSGSFGVSLGYMVTPQWKFAVSYHRISFVYEDTITALFGDNPTPILSGFGVDPTSQVYGVSLSYYFTTSRIKPFVQADLGYQTFNYNMEVPSGADRYTIEDINRKYNIRSYSGLYAATVLGADMRLFRQLDFQIASRLNFMKPFNSYTIHAGFVISMGNHFPEVKK